MKRFTTLADVIEHIQPALDASDGTYNAEAIAAEAFTYKTDTDANGWSEANTAGFEQTVTEDEFWAIVMRHQIPENDCN